MGKRQLNDWLTSYLKYTEQSESPVSFHHWAGVSAIAAALQRKVYLKWGHSTIYPNQYIVLVGPSGASRKGEAINIARGMAESIKIPLIGEDNSMEAIIVEMKNAITSFIDKGNSKLTFQCAVSCFVEELSVFTGQQNTQFLAYLTNWYDSRDQWKRTTKHQGTDEIMGMCYNMLAATAPDWIPYILPREAIGGGFTSRCLFIVENRKSKIVADPNAIPPQTELKRSLARDLEAVHSLSGAMHLDRNALELYIEWYTKQETDILSGKSAIKDALFQGYMARRATHFLKTMMIVSASRGDDLVVIEKDFKRARGMLDKAERNMINAFSGIGKAKYAEETQKVLDYIAINGKVTKADILTHFFRSLDDYGLDTIIKVLSGMKAIRVVIAREGTFYEYTRKAEPEDPASIN